MATITATASGGTRNWSDTATWSPAQVPTAADDVVLASTSGNVTVDAVAACRSLDCQASGNYAGTLTFASGSTLKIGDATAGTGNRAMRLSSTMTTSLLGGYVHFVSTSATVQSITSAGKTNANIIFNGAGGSWQFADAFAVGNQTIDLTRGTLDTNNQAVSCGTFASNNANTRTLTLGSSTITCTGGGNAFDVGTVTNLTMTANTATLVLSGTSAGVNNGVGWNPNGLSLVLSGASYAFCNTQACTYANLTRTGTASKNDYMIIYGASVTVTGTFTCTGNSATNRVQVTSNLTGTARTITAAVASLSNADFMDIGAAGAATWAGSSLGDAGGNSGITFSPSRTLYRVAAGNWSDTNWSLTSGGVGGLTAPLPQDDVVLNASSGVGTITIDMPRVGKDVACTGYAGTLASSVGPTIYGSWTFASTMTQGMSAGVSFAGRGSHTITSSGKAFSGQLNFNAVGGSYSLLDALSTPSLLAVSDGTLVTNDYSVTCAGFTSNSGRTRAIQFGASVVTLTSTTGWTVAAGGINLNMGTSIVVFSDSSATTKTVAGGGQSYARMNVPGGTGGVALTGANTFTGNISVASGGKLTLPSSTTTTLSGSATIVCADTGTATIKSSTGGTAATLSKATGTLAGDFVAVTDITATGGATFDAGIRATVTNSTGWNATGTLTRSASCPHSSVGRSGVAKTFAPGATCATSATGRAVAAKACNVSSRAIASHVGSGSATRSVSVSAKGISATAGGAGRRYASWKVLEGGA